MIKSSLRYKIAIKRILCVTALMLSLFVAVLSLCNIHVLSHTMSKVVSPRELEDKKFDCILVLGAGINDDMPSDMLKDRLDMAIMLFNMGCSDVMLLSGDRSGDHYDEVTVMKNYCIDNGVDPDAIVCDNIGYSTYESVYNAKSSGRFESVLIVTQGYHLQRALFIADKMGLDAFGVSATTRAYRDQFIRDVREGFARAKDLFLVTFCY